MAQFQYTAVNSAGKKLTGVIGAATDEEARKELNSLGISVLVMNKIAETGEKSITTESNTSQALPKFEFEAIDKNARKVIGTIPASNRYRAFKRLMEEYKFEVSYVVTAGASPEEKMKAKQEDLSVLKSEYEEQLKKEGKSLSETKDSSTELFEKKRDLLLKKVDIILNKIKALLNGYKDEISPENQKIIQNYIDKLLRIKSSTNLDYIEHTSEELLKKVQDQELFLHKEKMADQRDQLKLETQKLMSELHSGPRDKKNLSDDLDGIQNQLALSQSRFMRGVGQWIKNIIPDEKEKEFKSKIKTINSQIWTYRKIWFKTPKSSRQSIRESMKTLNNEKKQVQVNLKAYKKTKQGSNKKAPEQAPLITEEITHFLGWLLAFYLIGYFLSHYAISKSFPGGNPLPGDFNLLASGTLRALLMSVFLWYIILSVRLEFLRNQNWSSLALLPSGLLLNAIILFNF
ncbi:MAG: hypothetical protein ACI9QC_000641 [Oceanicoccus sp.]|jgi:hypothetical protein